jgi:hypothetical protein
VGGCTTGAIADEVAVENYSTFIVAFEAPSNAGGGAESFHDLHWTSRARYGQRRQLFCSLVKERRKLLIPV